MTLTQAVYWTKRVGAALIVLFLLFIPLRLIIIIINAGGGVTRPREDLPFASQGYGVLPQMSLTSLALPAQSSPGVQLETAAGEFPDIPPVVQVYKLKEKLQTLTTLDEAKQLAGRFGFKSLPNRIPNSTKYSWQDTAGRLMTYDVSNQNFNLKTDYTKDIYQKVEIVPSLVEAEERSLAHLRTLQLLDESYLNGYMESGYLKLGPNGGYLKAGSQSEADFVRVDFFRNTQLVKLTEEETALLAAQRKGDVKLDPEELPESVIGSIKTPEINKSNIYIIIRGKNLSRLGDIYELEYNFWEVDENETETYYTRAPAEAWEDVKDGNAYLRHLVAKQGEPYKEYTPINVDQFLIYDISLVYLETKEFQEFLQPVYMLRGEARSVGNTGKPDLDFAYLTSAVKEY